MLSDKELRRNGNYWAMKAKAWLTETREDHPEELTKAYKWFDTASKLTQAKPPRDLPLDRLVRDANQHIRAVERLSSALATDPSPVYAAQLRTKAEVLQKRLKKWKALVAGWENHLRVAAGEAEVLPEAFTAAAEWFAARAKPLNVSDGGGTGCEPVSASDAQALADLASEGNRRIIAVHAMRSSYPRGSRATIPWRLRKWKQTVIGWEVVASEAALQALRAGRRRGNLRDAEKNFVEAKEVYDSQVRLRESLKQACREYRAKQRKKRTCSHCGTTAPFSSRAFPYCGGCRHSDVARKDRPRYCSEECQRAHWLAGHMNECPCTG